MASVEYRILANFWSEISKKFHFWNSANSIRAIFKPVLLSKYDQKPEESYANTFGLYRRLWSQLNVIRPRSIKLALRDNVLILWSEKSGLCRIELFLKYNKLVYIIEFSSSEHKSSLVNVVSSN